MVKPPRASWRFDRARPRDAISGKMARSRTTSRVGQRNTFLAILGLRHSSRDRARSRASCSRPGSEEAGPGDWTVLVLLGTDAGGIRRRLRITTDLVRQRLPAIEHLLHRLLLGQLTGQELCDRGIFEDI